VQWTAGAGKALGATKARVTRKQIQVKTRKSPCISLDSFGGIVTFQWVTAEKNKKTSAFTNSRFRLSAKRLLAAPRAPSCPSCRRRRFAGTKGFDQPKF
jgi:hypothetical protein